MENTLHQNDFRRSDSPEEVYYSNPGRKTYYIACCPGMYIPEILLQLHCPVQEVRKYNQTALFLHIQSSWVMCLHTVSSASIQMTVIDHDIACLTQIDHTSGTISRLYLMATGQSTDRNIVAAFKSQYFSIGWCRADHDLFTICCFHAEVMEIFDRIFRRFIIIRNRIQFRILDFCIIKTGKIIFSPFRMTFVLSWIASTSSSTVDTVTTSRYWYSLRCSSSFDPSRI